MKLCNSDNQYTTVPQIITLIFHERKQAKLLLTVLLHKIFCKRLKRNTTTHHWHKSSQILRTKFPDLTTRRRTDLQNRFIGSLYSQTIAASNIIIPKTRLGSTQIWLFKKIN